MTLPSYDDVSDAKASVETVQGLATEPKKETGGNIGGKKKESGPSEKAIKKKEAALAKQKAREEFERENLGGKKVETVDMNLPSYGESTAKP